MKFILKCHLYCFLLILVAGCAAQVARFKDESDLSYERVRASGMEALLPVEVRDFYRTHDLAGSEFAKGDIRSADFYYSLAVGKAEILEQLYTKELQRREEAARFALELRRQAEAEMDRQKKLEQERAEAAALEAAERAARLEAEKAEARRRAERAKHEKEVQPVARHTVKRGETLPQIAALPEVYGDSSLWPLIYKANRDQIGNPAVLWPGQVLRIPRNYDRNDINEARRFSADRALR